MKKIILILACNAFSIVSCVFAGLLCLKSIDGWGWFLLVAFLSVNFTNYNSED